MLVVVFRTEQVKRACCDLAHMRRRWGSDVVRLISRRVQQLEAMTGLQDLAFLPFDSYDHQDGIVEVAVNEDLSLIIQGETDPDRGETAVPEIMIMSINDRQTMARTP